GGCSLLPSSVVARASSVCMALRTGSGAEAGAAAGVEADLSFAAEAQGKTASWAARMQHAAARRNSVPRKWRLSRVLEDSEMVMKSELPVPRSIKKCPNPSE